MTAAEAWTGSTSIGGPSPAHPLPRHFDAAIVGLGAAGCWAAKVLAGHGLNVVALDAGRLLSSRDLPVTVRPAGYWSRILAGRRWVQARSISFHPRISHLYVDDGRNPYTTRGGETFLWIRGRQVGGRLHTWARMALRLSDRDFRRAESDGKGQPWPIGYRDLVKYYDEIESFHGLYGSRDGLEAVPDGLVSEPGAFTAPAAMFKRRVEARWPERRVILPRILKAPTDPLPAPLRDALGTGRLRLITEAPVARVLLNPAGDRAVGVEFVDVAARRTSRVSADRVFLCASSVESVRILLNSRCAAHPAGVGNDRGLLGRYLLEHNLVVASGTTGDEYRRLASSFVPRPTHPLDLSSELDFYIPDFSETLGDRSFVRGFGIQGRITPEHWGMGVFGEMLPDPDNRVTLSGRMDACGIPIVNISIRRGENDRRMIATQKRQLRDIAEAAGLRVEMPLPGLVRWLLWRAVGPEVGVMHLGVAIHETGGARMGDDPRMSVTNPRNQVWEVPNLYVTDGACFPSTGCQNPTLTIMALTARACDLALRS